MMAFPQQYLSRILASQNRSKADNSAQKENQNLDLPLQTGERQPKKQSPIKKQVSATKKSPIKTSKKVAEHSPPEPAMVKSAESGTLSSTP